MPKSVMFVIFLLLAALGASLTLVTGEASPVRADEDAEVIDGLAPGEEAGQGSVEEMEEAQPEAEPEAQPEEPVVEDFEVDPMAASLEVLANAESPSSERLGAAKSILLGLEGSDGQAALMEQVSTLEAAIAADSSAAIPSEFIDAVTALAQGN